MAKKSTVNKAGNYTKPGMRKRLFQNIKAGSKGGPPGVWSARKAQLLARRYKSSGGGYKEDGGIVAPKYASGGKTKSQKSLDQWTAEDWGNVSGKKGDRYLPKKVREGMSPGQKAAENKKKRQATKSGKVKAKYSDSLKKSMRNKGVYSKGGSVKDLKKVSKELKGASKMHLAQSKRVMKHVKKMAGDSVKTYSSGGYVEGK